MSGENVAIGGDNPGADDTQPMKIEDIITEAHEPVGIVNDGTTQEHPIVRSEADASHGPLVSGEASRVASVDSKPDRRYSSRKRWGAIGALATVGAATAAVALYNPGIVPFIPRNAAPVESSQQPNLPKPSWLKAMGIDTPGAAGLLDTHPDLPVAQADLSAELPSPAEQPSPESEEDTASSETRSPARSTKPATEPEPDPSEPPAASSVNATEEPTAPVEPAPQAAVLQPPVPAEQHTTPAAPLDGSPVPSQESTPSVLPAEPSLSGAEQAPPDDDDSSR